MLFIVKCLFIVVRDNTRKILQPPISPHYFILDDHPLIPSPNRSILADIPSIAENLPLHHG